MLITNVKRQHTQVQISEPYFDPKNDTFKFYEDKKCIKIFTGMNSKYFHIYDDKKYILAFI